MKITGWKQYECHLCRTSLVPAASPTALVPALLREAGDTDQASLCLHRAPQEGGAWVGWRGGVADRPGNPLLWPNTKNLGIPSKFIAWPKAKAEILKITKFLARPRAKAENLGNPSKYIVAQGQSQKS